MLRETADAWINNNAPRLSASVAFYSVLSLIPFLIVVTALAGFISDRKAVQSQLMWDIQDLIGTVGAEAIRGLMQTNHQSTAITIVGLITLAIGTSGVVMELRDALNTIWQVPAQGSYSGFNGLLRIVRERFYLFGLIAIGGLLLVASLAINAIVIDIGDRLGIFLPVHPVVLQTGVFLLSYLSVTGLFAAIYKLVPDIELRWSDVAVGAAVTALIFTLGKHLIGIYLARISFSVTYGPAGSFLILLVWVYYSAQLFFFGAEFTHVYARRLHPRKGIK